jgi:hypothetical protein
MLEMYLRAFYAAYPDLCVWTNKQAIYHCTKNHVYNRQNVSTNVLVANILTVFHLTSIWLAIVTSLP